MTPGFIYVLQNRAFGAYVVKIGLTTRAPDLRAREIYTGATGVPLPFEVAVAFSVGDCKLAEKTIHRRLKAFRLNARREFFRSSPSVAATIALEECAAVNEGLGLSAPEILRFPRTPELQSADEVTEVSSSPSKDTAAERIAVAKLRESPLGTSTLTDEQLDRARIVGMLLQRAHPKSVREWQEGFPRDLNPESEIRIWEEMTKAYLNVEQADFASAEQREEAFALLLARSWEPRQTVLENHTLKHFTLPGANRLLKLYTLKPKPLLVRRTRSRNAG